MGPRITWAADACDEMDKGRTRQTTDNREGFPPLARRVVVQLERELRLACRLFFVFFSVDRS
jgi:hypothetical protein